MNIIKLRDIIMPADLKMAEFFNTKLKGKYAYWIQMRYIFPLDALSYNDYIIYEQYDEVHFMSSDIQPHIDMYDEDCCMIDFVNAYIDTCATEEANCIYEFIASNKYAAEADVDISILRNFRTWLATEVLKLYKNSYNSTSECIHMLEYYKNNMYDDTLMHLNTFAGKTVNVKFNANTSGCSCNNNISSLYSTDTVSVCDPMSIYINGIHNYMVKTFSDSAFWMNLNIDFIRVFKKYIDNIIQVGFTINKPIDNNAFVDCSCSISNDIVNSTETMLKKLSVALGYIIENDVKGHANYIYDALYNWAEHLYEYMYWPVN